jgi:hypothetical protein
MHAHPAACEMRVLKCAQHHAQQCLLLLGPQRLQGTALEAAKHPEVYVTVC